MFVLNKRHVLPIFCPPPPPDYQRIFLILFTKQYDTLNQIPRVQFACLQDVGTVIKSKTW